MRGRGLDGPPVLQPAIGVHVQRSRDDVAVIEPQRLGAVRNGLVPIDGLGVGFATGLRRPVQAQVPLADAGGGVAVPLEQRGHRQTVGFDQGLAVAAEHAFLEARPPAVAPGQEAVPRGGADRRGRVRVGEPNPLRGQSIHRRRRHFRLPTVAAGIAVPQVVGENEDDVGPAARLCEAPALPEQRCRRSKACHPQKTPACMRLACHAVTPMNAAPKPSPQHCIASWESDQRGIVQSRSFGMLPSVRLGSTVSALTPINNSTIRSFPCEIAICNGVAGTLSTGC